MVHCVITEQHNMLSRKLCEDNSMCSFVVVVVNLLLLVYSSDVFTHAFDVCQ